MTPSSHHNFTKKYCPKVHPAQLLITQQKKATVCTIALFYAVQFYMIFSTFGQNVQKLYSSFFRYHTETSFESLATLFHNHTSSPKTFRHTPAFCHQSSVNSDRTDSFFNPSLPSIPLPYLKKNFEKNKSLQRSCKDWFVIVASETGNINSVVWRLYFYIQGRKCRCIGRNFFNWFPAVL